MHRLTWSTLLCLLLLLALGGAPVAGQAASGAGLVVRYPDGSVAQYCVTVPPDGLTALEALQQVGLPLRVEMQGNGAAICAIGGQGCTAPDAPCFCQCEGGGPCLYWTFYHWQGGRWVSSNLGASNSTVRAGTIDGWGWGSPPPAPGGAALCATPAAPPTATPVPPTRKPVPPTPRPATPTPRPARPVPSATPRVIPPTATRPAPARSPSPGSVPVTPLPPVSTATPESPAATATPLPAPPTVPATATVAPPIVASTVAAPSPALPVPTLPPVPTPIPVPSLAGVSDSGPGGLLAFALIVAVLLGALGWLRLRRR